MAVKQVNNIDKQITESVGIYDCEITVETAKRKIKGRIICSRFTVEHYINKFLEDYTDTDLGINRKSNTEQTLRITVKGLRYLSDVTKQAQINYVKRL